MFTSEEDAFILMAHFRSGTIKLDGTWSYSLQNCIDQFIECYPKANVDYHTFRQHRQVLISRFETKNCICNDKSIGRPIRLAVIKSIQNRVDQSSNKTAAQTGLSVNIKNKKETATQRKRRLEKKRQYRQAQFARETAEEKQLRREKRRQCYKAQRATKQTIKFEKKVF